MVVPCPRLATLTHASTSVADSRFEHYWASAQYFNGTLGCGTRRRCARPDGPILRAIGRGGAVRSRHGACPPRTHRSHRCNSFYPPCLRSLYCRGASSLFRPRVGLEHLLSGLAYVFQPVARPQFPAALPGSTCTPLSAWLGVSLVRSCRGDDSPWRLAPSLLSCLLVVRQP